MTMSKYASRAHLLEDRIRQFQAAIDRIAAHVGAVCGGVDIEHETDDNGVQFGPGGHTAYEIVRKINELKKDAMRYRWLRHYMHDHILKMFNDPSAGLDALIDGAMLLDSRDKWADSARELERELNEALAKLEHPYDPELGDGR